MNPLQTEYKALRDAGMKPGPALASMLDWRRRAAVSLVLSGRIIPGHVADLSTELVTEIERLRMTRNFVGVRP